MFSDLETLEIQEQIYKKTYQQVPNTVSETLDTEKPKTSKQKEILSDSNRNTIQPNTTIQILTQEEKLSEENMKGIMSEKKPTLPSLRNQQWKTLNIETEKNKRLINKWTISSMQERSLRVKKSELPWRTRAESQNLDGNFDWKDR